MSTTCAHEPRRTEEQSCVKCGFPIEPWHLTVKYAREFYAAVGLPDLADHAIARLSGPAAAEYKWFAYLDRENIPEGIDEGVDFLHYALFEILKTYLLERRGLDPIRAERVREHMVRGAAHIVAGIREFQAGEAELKG